MATRNALSVRSRLARKLAAYAGVAGMATLGADVEGAIVYTDLGAGVTIEPREPTESDFVVNGTFEIDVDLDGQLDFMMGHWTLWGWTSEYVCTWKSTYSYNFCYDRRVRAPRAQQGYLSGAGGNRVVLSEDERSGRFASIAARLLPGTAISPDGPASLRVTLTSSYFALGPNSDPYFVKYGEFEDSAGYAGVVFEAADQQLHTGWLHIQEQAGRLTLFAFAYETEPGVPIVAGDTGNSAIVPGDTNADGKVDLEDLNNVRNNFGATGAGIPGDTAPFDGEVDLDDLNAVRNNFGATSGANPVPEPPSLLLLAAGGAGLAEWRRKGRRLQLA